MTLLGSMLSSYANLVTVLEAKTDGLSLEYVRQSLLNEEQKRDGGESSGSFGDQALVSTNNCSRQGDREVRGCYTCGDTGHFQRECPEAKRDRDKRSRHGAQLASQRWDANDEESCSDVGFTVATASASHSNDRKKEWIVDSGASRHDM